MVGVESRLTGKHPEKHPVSRYDGTTYNITIITITCDKTSAIAVIYNKYKTLT